MKQLHWDQFCVMTTHYQQHTLEYTLDSIAANGFRNVELWGASPHYCYDDYTPSGRNARVQEMCIRDRPTANVPGGVTVGARVTVYYTGTLEEDDCVVTLIDAA